MKLDKIITLILVSCGLTATAYAANDEKIVALQKQLADNAAKMAEMQKHFVEMDQKIHALEGELSTVGVATSEANTTISGSGINLTSSNKKSDLRMNGFLALENRAFFQDGGINGNEGFFLPTARLAFTGTTYGIYDFSLKQEFGGTNAGLLEGYVNCRLSPGFQIKLGKFKSPVSLAGLQDDEVRPFYRSLAANLESGYDIGAMLHGALSDGAITYAAGIFDGFADGASIVGNAAIRNQLGFAGRLFFEPWKNSDVKAMSGFGFGVGGSFVVDNTTNATALTAGYMTSGGQRFFNYSNGVVPLNAAWRVVPQLHYYYGPFGVLAEYVINCQNSRNQTYPALTMHNTAWEVTGCWALTGEEESFTGLTPLHPFQLNGGGWGAWELVAQVSGLNVDSQAFSKRFADRTLSAQKALAFGFGLNWYLNKNIRASVSYERTTFSSYGGKLFSYTPTLGAPYHSENTLFSRVQLAF